MKGLDPLIAVAVVGTARRALDPATLPAGVVADDRVPTSSPDALLRIAARAAVLDKITLPAPVARALPAPPEESIPAPRSPDFSSALRHAVAAGGPALVAEALRLLAERGRRLPIGDLHLVLEAAVNRRELRPLLAAVLGDRGRWFADLNPIWRFDELLTVDPDDEACWKFGTPAERVAWLAAVRSVDPDRGRSALAADFGADDAPTRAALLATVITGLAPADEPFLDAALDDRSGEVRARARDLLARLPDSAYVGRMRDRIAARINPTRGGRWQVDLGGLGPTDQRDGVALDRADQLPGATAVRALVGGVPLATWSTDFDYPAVELADIRAGSLELGPLPGLRAAALRERDGSVAEAVLRHAEWGSDPELVGCLAKDRHDAVLAARVRSRGPADSMTELQAAGFGQQTAQVLLEWLGEPRSAGSRGPVIAALGTRGPAGPEWDLAAALRRLSAVLHGADQNRAFRAAVTINLRRSLAAAVD